MGIVTCKLEEQLSDLRSNQVAFKFHIDNGGLAPIRLLNVLPRLPEEAQLVDVKDRSSAAATTKRIEILEDLTKLLNQQLWLKSEDVRKDWVSKQKALYSEIFTVAGYLKALFEMLFSRSHFEARVNREFETARYKITSLEDARAAATRWMEDVDDKNVLAALFIEKVEQLARVDSLVNDSEKRALSIIEPGSFSPRANVT